MKLDIGREFKLSQVITASELFRRLLDTSTVWTFEDLHRVCNALPAALKDSGFDRTLESSSARRFEQTTKQLDHVFTQVSTGEISYTDADGVINNYLPRLQQWGQSLKGEFDDEMELMPVCLPESRSPGIDDWYEIERQFGGEEFRALPLTARQSFLEAGRCFLFEQFTACAVMSMRAAEAVLREYYYRLKREEPGDRDNWGDLVSKLNISDKVLQRNLEAGRVWRNTLIHPSGGLVQTNAGHAQDCFNLARTIGRQLMQDLRQKLRALSVGVCIEIPGGKVSLDVLVALWLLSYHQNGIGRLAFIRPEEPDFSLPNLDQYDFLLGAGSQNWDIPSEQSYAFAVANDLNVVSQHQPLLDYCNQWLVAWLSNRPINKTAVYEHTFVYEHTLEGVIDAVQVHYISKDKKLESLCERIFSILNHVKNRNLDPTDPELAQKLSIPWLNEAIDYLRKANQTEVALKRKQEVVYDTLSGVVTVITSAEFEPFSNRLFDEGYQLVALTDEVQSMWIGTNMNTTSLVRIANVLRQRLGDTNLLDLRQRNRIFQKQPVRLSISDLVECLHMAAKGI